MTATARIRSLLAVCPDAKPSLIARIVGCPPKLVHSIKWSIVHADRHKAVRREGMRVKRAEAHA